MKRFSLRDTALMLAPVAVLGIFGYLLSARKPAVMVPVGSFELYIRRIQVLPASPIEVFDGYDTRVLVEFDAHGSKPLWWNNGFGGYSSQNRGKLVRVKSAQTASLGQKCYGSESHLDVDTKRWICTYNLKLADIPSDSGQIRLRDTIEFRNNANKKLAKLWLDAPIRANGAATKIPLVSRVPAVKLEQFSLDPSTPIESQNGSRFWRIKWTLFKNIPRTGADSDNDSAYISAVVVNRKGEQVGSWQTSSSSLQESDVPGAPHPQVDPRRSFTRQQYNLSSMSASSAEPLWIKGSIGCGDKWPLAIKIPIRDATGKMLSSPRNPKVPFRVVSVSKVTPTPEEAAERADCAVQLVLQAWDLKADTQQWQWETNYSQHIVNAFGGEFWDFPFKTGKRASISSSSWSIDKNRMTIRYSLALKTIDPREGRLVFHASIAANRSRFVPIQLVVRP